MKNIVFSVIVLCLNIHSVLACLSTYQYKIFPVGTLNNQLVTVDFQIKRSEDNSPARHVKIGFNRAPQTKQVWSLKSYISIYDKQQKLISNIAFESGQINGENYLKKMQSLYQTAIEKVVKDYPQLILFNPQSLSFCNFNKSCDLVSIENKPDQEKDFVVYNAKVYEIQILKDSSYIGFNNSIYYANHSRDFYLSSSRTYINKSGRLLICHFETGTNLAFYEDEKHAYTPDLEFVDLKKAVYQEPVLHHGFGYDVMVWIK